MAVATGFQGRKNEKECCWDLNMAMIILHHIKPFNQPTFLCHLEMELMENTHMALVSFSDPEIDLGTCKASISHEHFAW